MAQILKADDHTQFVFSTRVDDRSPCAPLGLTPNLTTTQVDFSGQIANF